MIKRTERPITRQLKHRLDADLYVAVAARAELEHRSISNLVEIALLHYLDRFTDKPTPSPEVIILPHGLGEDRMGGRRDR